MSWNIIPIRIWIHSHNSASNNGIFLCFKCLFLCVRAPPIHIIMMVRKAANQKILNDNKKFNNLVNQLR
jgi:hypothetical protein